MKELARCVLVLVFGLSGAVLVGAAIFIFWVLDSARALSRRMSAPCFLL